MRSISLYIRSHPYLIALSLLAIIQILIIMAYQFNGFFGQDSYEYLKTTRELIAYYKTGVLPGYSVFPGFYPFICSLIALIIPNTLFVLQFVSILSVFAAYILLREIIRLIYKTDKFIGIYLLLFFTLSPYILRFSIISMSDITGIALWLASLYFSLLFHQKGKIRFLIFACLFGGFAVMTRYTAIVILIMPAYICISQIIKQKKYSYFIIAFIFFMLGSLPDYLLKGRLFFWDVNGSSASFSYFYFLDQYAFSNFFKKDFNNLDGWQHYQFSNIIYLFQIFFHPAFIFIGALLLIFVRRAHFAYKEHLLTLLTIIIYILFLAGNPYQGDRYLMFAFPLILIFYYPALLEITNRFSVTSKNLVVIMGLVCALQLFLFIYSFKVTVEMNRNEKDIAEAITLLSNESTVYTFSIDGALKAYQPDIKIYDLYLNKLNDSTIHNGYLLFNYDAFSHQFTDLNPMQNYRYLESHYVLKSEKKFENGWELFSIK